MIVTSRPINFGRLSALVPSVSKKMRRIRFADTMAQSTLVSV
jgi:hypothetical protein